MGYYEDLVPQIEALIKDEKYDKMFSLIEKELSLPYVPSNIETKLKDLLKLIPKDDFVRSLSDEEIIKYLNLDETKQLRAVEELNNKNLRDYLDVCNGYLKGNGYINAKVLLIDSLIKQDINEEISMSNNGVDYNFIPKYVMSPECSIGFVKASEILGEKYMKEPSKLELAKQLLYKECLLALPINYEEDEADQLANKIYLFIEEAFK
ncbi:MAG: DUF3196 family protein [Erysipelotrichaceae bacterium]|nr:DUF3196 family protein [Erysipelotrichaceae bacterium]